MEVGLTDAMQTENAGRGIAQVVIQAFGKRLHVANHNALPVVLVLAGVAIGYGAKAAGGCTSGNGLGGCATGSRASLTATGTFMATAIGLSFLLRAVT